MKKVCLVMAWLAWLPLVALASPEEDDFVPSTLGELQAAVADVRAVLSEEQRTMLDTHRARRQGQREADTGRWTSGEGRGMRGRSPRMAHLQQALGLSDEQAAEIREIRANGGSREDVRAVLTDEQRVLMDEHRANRQGRRDGKGGNQRSRDGRNAVDAVGEDEPAAG